jgi:NADH:ubiquinone oxidoreductase subunit H
LVLRLEISVARFGASFGADGVLRGRARPRARCGFPQDGQPLDTQHRRRANAGNIIDWNIVQTWVVPFIIFWIAGTAELNRPPFDLVEAEQELVGGFHTEYSSIRFAMFFLAEFMNTITMSAIIVTVFSAAQRPSFGPDWVRSWIFPTLWFMVKLIVFLFAFVWFRRRCPACATTS